MNAEKTPLVESDFRLLTKKGLVGFYQSCEVTTISLIDNLGNWWNFYTLIVYEESTPAQNSFGTPKNMEFITPQLTRVNSKYKLGIIRYRLTMEQTEQQFLRLLHDNEWDDKLQIGDLYCIPKQFIPVDSTITVPLNSVLKNNFYNGSYILEFFDTEKGNYPEIIGSNKDLAKVCAIISDLIPIDLLFIQDRIGNIIFQFPSRLLAWKMRSLDAWQGVEVDIAWHPETQRNPEVAFATMGSNDKSIMGFHQLEDLPDGTYKLASGNSEVENQILIFNKQENAVLASSTSYFMRNISVALSYSTQHAEPRRIKSKEGLEVAQIEVSQLNDTPQRQSVDYLYHISRRALEDEKRKLSNGLVFVQYGRGKREREKGLQDLRTLINRHGRSGVYLWDPYLHSDDILNTLYYCQFARVPMRAIGSFRKIKRKSDQKHDFTEWKVLEQAKFNARSNHLGINLEFRSQHDRYGWGFHDRFLIFPNEDDKPRAWSLGTSINSFGKEHHILQEISNAKLILDAFLELWEMLDPAHCLVWGIGHE